MGKKSLPIIGLALLAIVTAALVVLSFLNVRPQPVEAVPAASGNPAEGSMESDPSEVPNSTPTPVQTPDPTATPTPRAPRTSTLANIKSAISGSEPVKIVVVGDNTGLDPNTSEHRWVSLWARDLAQNRPVTLAVMETSGSYGEPQELGSGNGAPIQILNASDRPRRISEVAAQSETVIPPDTDIVLINFGHHESVNQLGSELDALWAKLPAGSMGLVMVQNPQRGAGVNNNQSRMTAVQNWAKQRPAPVINVYDAFIADPEPLADLLASDQIQPNARGSEIWKDAINAALR